MKSIKYSIVVLCVLALAGCVTATPYRKAVHQHDYGYQEFKIEENRYRLSFSGNSETPRQIVENYLLYRAAELTLEQGKDYFVIVNSGTDKNTEHQSTVVGAPALALGYGHHHGRGRHQSFGFGFNIINATFNDYQAYGTVLLQSGTKSPTDVHAYNAKEVVTNLGPSIQFQNKR